MEHNYIELLKKEIQGMYGMYFCNVSHGAYEYKRQIHILREQYNIGKSTRVATQYAKKQLAPFSKVVTFTDPCIDTCKLLPTGEFEPLENYTVKFTKKGYNLIHYIRDSGLHGEGVFAGGSLGFHGSSSLLNDLLDQYPNSKGPSNNGLLKLVILLPSGGSFQGIVKHISEPVSWEELLRRVIEIKELGVELLGDYAGHEVFAPSTVDRPNLIVYNPISEELRKKVEFFASKYGLIAKEYNSFAEHLSKERLAGSHNRIFGEAYNGKTTKKKAG